MSARSGAAAASPARPVLAHGQAGKIDGEYAGDHWNAQRLGVPARRGRQAARFDAITQDWLRDPVKRWSRFRLATGCAFATISAGALALSRFSAFLGRAPPGHRRRGGHHPAGPGGLPVLASRSGLLGFHPGAVAEHAPGVLRRLPPPRVAARAGPWRRHLRRRASLPPRPGGPFHPRVRDGPARVRRRPGPAAVHHHPQPRRGPDRDRAARRGRLRPGIQPHPRRQRRLAVPAFRGRQGPRRAADPAQRQGRGGDPLPARARPPAAGPRAARGCSPGSPATTTAPSPTRTAPSAGSSRTGSASSTCATRPASPSP